MNLTDIIGSGGVLILLLAYFLNVFNLLKREGILYSVLNLIGAVLAGIASWMLHYIPFVVLECAWALVSISALLSSIKRLSPSAKNQ